MAAGGVRGLVSSCISCACSRRAVWATGFWEGEVALCGAVLPCRDAGVWPFNLRVRPITRGLKYLDVNANGNEP